MSWLLSSAGPPSLYSSFLPPYVGLLPSLFHSSLPPSFFLPSLILPSLPHPSFPPSFFLPPLILPSLPRSIRGVIHPCGHPGPHPPPCRLQRQQQCLVCSRGGEDAWRGRVRLGERATAQVLLPLRSTEGEPTSAGRVWAGSESQIACDGVRASHDCMETISKLEIPTMKW